MGEIMKSNRVLVIRDEGKRPLGITRRRWDDNIKLDLKGIGCEGVNWIHLAQDRIQWRTLGFHKRHVIY
jgi:hypothetical protein